MTREEVIRKLGSGNKDFSYLNLSRLDLSNLDFRGANLRGADLRGANLRGANIDYTCWPLFCGGLHVKINKRIACQLAYHFCNQDCNDPEYIVARNAILSFANQFHRVNECGLLKEIAEFRPQLDDGQTANGEKDGF